MSAASEVNPFRVTPLGPALGAEVTGVDLSRPPDAASASALRAAFLEHHLLCIRSDPLPAAALAALGRCLGEPKPDLLRAKRHPEVPEVAVLESTYRTPADKPVDPALNRLAGWHTDDSYFEIPAKATILQALALPDSGGETRFCNTERAWDEASEDLRRRLAGRRAVHAYDTWRTSAVAPARTRVEADETPEVVHPLVRTHEETGREAIYFNQNRTDRVVGLDRAASDALLDAILTHITQGRFRYDHHWRLGDVLVWDNRCLVHSVNTDYPVGQRRLHHRMLLAGTRPA